MARRTSGGRPAVGSVRPDGAVPPTTHVERRLLRAALGKWERSTHFHPGPVDQSVRLTLRDVVPEAWALGGHEIQEALADVLAAWAGTGLVTVPRRRHRHVLPEAVLVTPAGLEVAYARQPGPTRRSHAHAMTEALAAVRASADVARAVLAAPWVAAWLEAAITDAAAAQFGRLGRKAAEPGCAPEVADAVRLVARLAERRPFDERTLSGELFGDTKRLRDLRPRVRQLLLEFDPRWQGVEAPDDRTLFVAYAEVLKPPFTAIALGLPVPEVADFRLFRPYALLPADALARVAAWCAASPVRPQITTIENERAFLRYLDEAETRARLEAGAEVVLYTEGFPSDDLLAFLGAAQCPMRHWGDTDVHGFRIALILGAAAGDVTLFRADAAWVRETPDAQGQALAGDHRRALERLVATLGTPSGASLPLGGPAIAAAARAVLETGRWFEQEVFYAAPRAVR